MKKSSRTTKEQTKKTTVDKSVKRPAKKETVKKTRQKPAKKLPDASSETLPQTPQPEEAVIFPPSLLPQKKPKPEKYFAGFGSRKRACAQVRLYTSNPQNSAEAGNIEVNNKPYKEYFPGEYFWIIVEDPMRKLKSMNRFRATVRVSGGGIHAQAEAVRHGLARALTLFDQNFRKRLKRAGYLTRDSREKERKKYGFKKARRRPQWAKR